MWDNKTFIYNISAENIHFTVICEFLVTSSTQLPIYGKATTPKTKYVLTVCFQFFEIERCNNIQTMNSIITMKYTNINTTVCQEVSY